MAEMTAEKFAQRAFDLDLLDAHQLESAWGEFGSRDVALGDFTTLMVRREFLTNFQVDRLLEGKREGYFYGDYKVLYLVGAGTFARVYRAVHRDRNKVVAVKVLRQRYSDDPVTREQFVREARMVMPLRHPNIVPIFEVLEQRNRPFMVMDFVEGQNLRDFLKVRKKLDLTNSMRIMADVLAALEYALKKGVMHRDLKLSNVLISSHGRARLVDFGLAAISADMSDEAIAHAANPRSIDYAGLERATGVRKNDARSDIYFAGAMLYQMVSGKAPLIETRDRILRLSVSRYRDVTPVSQEAPGLPRFIAAMINRAMDFKPEKRYASPTEMLHEAKKIMERLKRGGEDSDSGVIEPVANEGNSADAALGVEGQSRRVMVVEWSVDRQNMLRDALKRRGYRVLVVGNPERALRRFAEHDDDEPLAECVIFDGHLMGIPVLEAYNRFGRDERTRSIPAILLLDKSQVGLAAEAKRAEHRLVAFEPITLGKLRGMLQRLLNLRADETSPVESPTLE